MKIDINKIKKGTSEVPPECQAIIQKLKTCYQDNNNENLLQELQQTTSWTYGKCELFHWVDVLNIFDDILEHGARRLTPGLWSLAADTYNKKSRDLLLEVLRFTTLLIEHSFSRHLYNSMEHLLVLMGSSNLEILNGVLNLLYMFSKRSNFIPRLHQESKSALLKYLMYLAESWGGRENGFGLASCCQEVLKPELRESATTLHFEYYDDTPNQKNKVTTIHIENIDKIDKSLSGIMDELIETYNVIESQRMVLFTQLRLAHGFSTYQRRLLCVQARLQAISVLAYSNGLRDNTHQAVLYNGLLEELVELLELSSPELVDIRAAALRTLTSVIHLDRNPQFPKKPGPRLLTIIDVTGASNYHGQLPSMVRTCIASLTGSQPHEQARAYGAQLQSFPLPLATALFSFLYHFASYEAGGEALVSCGMMESLLKVINWPGENLDQITFVTRAVRVIDLIANIDMTSFQAHQGLASFINRLEMEVNICRKEQPFEIKIPETNETMPEAEEIEPTAAPVVSTENNSSVWRHGENSNLARPGGDNNESSMLEEPVPSTSVEGEGVRWNQSEFSASSSSQKPVGSANPSEFPGQASASTSQSTETDVPMKEGQEGNEPWVPKIIKIFSNPEQNSETAMEVDEDSETKPAVPATASNDTVMSDPQPGTSASVPSQHSSDPFERTSKVKESVDYSGNRWQDAKTGKTCLPERAGLIKSILNFLKKAIQDQAFSESMRTVMEGSLPSSLKHVISNSDYYGPYLFLLATDVVTVYIFQEPSLLSTLQDNYLTDVVLQAMLVKEVPATREVLASLPNVISALCLNSRGLAQFKQFHSFDHLCEIFVHPLYLPAMRRRRSNDPLGDTATTLGRAMDELMRHHPDLKTEAMKAVIDLLDEIYMYGTSPQYTCESYTSKKTSVSPDPPTVNNADGGGSSDEEEDEDKEAPSASYYVRADATQGKPHTPIPLIDYIYNVMKFVDAILSNNSTEDHCKEFVALGGLKYVVKLLSMPNLPADYAVTPAAQAVANVCKSILSLAREPKVLEEGLKELQQVLTRLEPLTDHSSGKCVLLHELAMVPDLDNALYSYNATPLLHSMAATHGFVIMFVHVCRTGQPEMRNTSIFTWGSALGLDILHKLSKLYTSLVWESTLLLALCSDDVIPSDCDFGQQDLNLLLPQKEGRLIRTTTEAMNTMKVESPSSSDTNGEGPSFTSSTKSKATRIAPTPEQLKHLKLLLGAASRLGRALAELFGLLVKLCVGSPKRRFTFQQQAFSYPAVGATDVAKAMSDLLARGLNWNLVPPAPLEKFKLTYLICSVGFTSPMLFDDKKQPYHMILHYFVESESEGNPSGLVAFFESMYHALAGDGSSENEKTTGKKEFPEGTGEFLDAWLMLLGKMTNPKMILDSPNVFVQEHKVENTSVLEFCPYRYLVKIHRMAFNAIMEMWCRKPLKGYGFRMTDSMLRILKHILVGEKILQERLEEASSKQISLTTYGDHIKNGPGYSNSFSNSPLDGSFPFQVLSSSTPNSHVQVNETLITQLCDMGFSRDAAIEALSQSRSIEMAIGYLVENNRSSYQDALDDLRVIEQNLSELFGTTSREASNSNTPREGTSSAGHSSSGPSTAGTHNDGKPRKRWRCEMPLAEREAEMMNDIKKYQLSQDTMNRFTENALSQCLEVLENLPETVYRVCDLLMVISDRNGFSWCENLLEVLCKDISTQVMQMLEEMNSSCIVTQERVQEVLVNSDNARKVSVRLHLLTLLFDDLRFACVRAMSHTCLICYLIQLLEVFGKYSNAKAYENHSGELLTPKWVAPLLLLLDLYEKTAVYTQRMHEMHKACTGVWKWFQLKTGKWTLYTSQNNKLINLAYWSGAPGCRVTVGETRRKYHINFNTLLQINEDTNRGSPITMILRQPDQDGLASEMTGGGFDKEKNKEYESIYYQAHNRSQHPIPSISESDRFTIIEACVKLMEIPVDPDALHALMRLTLRLTRNYSLAKFFSEKGGVTALLNLEQDSHFVGFNCLATLILRHIMEDPATLRNAIERTIRSRISTEIQPFFRELLFMMRHSEAGICRNPELYLEIAQKVLQIEYCDSYEGRYILKYVRKAERSTPEDLTFDKTAISLIRTLLDQLVIPDEYLLKSYSESNLTENNPTTKETTATHSQNKFSVNDFETICSVLDIKKPTESKEKEKEFSEEKKSRKLLSKSAILSVLTDAVKSYAGFSKLIMDHVYEADSENPVLSEDMTAVRFILEKFVLLPGVDKESLEISAEARLLLGAVGACNYSTPIQSALVVEVKNCIQRIVSSHYEDTKKKYTDVSCILSLISDMMAVCPPVNWLSIVNNSFIKLKNNTAHLSNISKLFTRKGLINELARLPHNLDLSNPNFVIAMNAALKPLETLTKLANDRGNRSHGVDVTFKAGTRQNNSNRPTQEAGTDPTLTNSSGTTSGNTNAQGEETNEDAENTENDLSAAAESLEPVSDSQVNDDITDIGEIVLEDQNMDRDTDRGSSMHMDDIVIPQDRETVENDDLPNSMTLETALMQMTSEMVHGLITDLQPSNQEQLTDPDDPDNLEEDQYDEQMEEDNNEADEGGYNNENDDPDDDFLMDTTVFHRNEHIMNDLFFVQYPSSEGETLGSFNELNSDDSSLRPEESVLQNPLPTYHPLLVRRNREDWVPLRNLRNRPRRYQFFQLNPPSRGLSNGPDILQNLLFSRRRNRSTDYRQAGDQDTHNLGTHHFRNSNLVLMENGFGMLTRSDEDNIDLLDQSMEYYFGQHLTTNMQSVCYVRWASEMKILDADSAAMAATVLSYKLRATLELHREELKAKHSNSPAMDVSSPPSSSENKNVEMADASQQNTDADTTALTQMENQSTALEDVADSARNDSVVVSQETSRLTEDSSSQSTNRTVTETNTIESNQVTESTDSNLRDAFTSYFNFDEVERVESDFPIFEANEEMADDEDGTETRDNFDLNAPSQETDSDLPFLGWESHPRTDDGLPLRRIPGSVSIAPTLVPPAVYPILSLPPPLPEVEIPSTVNQAEDRSNTASVSNEVTPEQNPPTENTTVNAEVVVEPETENNETANRTNQLFPDFLPSIFTQNTDNQERITSSSQPPPPFSETEMTCTSTIVSATTTIITTSTTTPTATSTTTTSTTSAAVDASGEETSANNTENANAANANDENASPVPLDPEEMIQLYPNGRATYRGISIPAGLDPSFLAALPSEMREEVFSNHLRQQSLQRSDLVRESTTPPSSSNTDEVNPEFLAALPLNIQEEVLAQQRQERQRQVAASTNHNDPFDAAAFFQNLPASLRQSILADIEESQISVLPPDLAAEAQNLRREQDARNRQYFQERERIISHNTLSSILGGSGGQGTRVGVHGFPSISQWGISSISRGSENAGNEPSFETVGRQLLDQEAVSTLLVLLFVQDFRLNISRLHRVIRNLCCHPPTRDFVSKTLISIMEKCNESRSNSVVTSTKQPSPKRKMPRSTYYYPHSFKGSDSDHPNQSSDPEPTWLNLSMDAALGCRANVFQVQLRRYGKRSLDNYLAHSVSIHPQAAPIVFRNAMDLLYTLTKAFQNEFLPKKPKDTDKVEDNAIASKPINTSFWDILVRLENLNSGKSSKKGKSALKNQTSTPFNEVEPKSTSFDKSLMGHLVTMLTYPLVKASPQLTDNLLHILNLVSEGFTELDEEEAVPVTEEHLKIIVNVLTSNGCTENGLEQATNLLIRMSNCPDPTRLTSLKLLISGAQEVAALVKQHIEALLMQLREANAKAKSDADLEVEMKENHRKGQIQDRFTKKSVVITAPSKVKGGFDIQLPAMQPLISKTSSQSFFLRILKVIIQLREVLVIRRKLETDQKKEDKDKKATSGSNQTASNPSSEQGSTFRRRLVNLNGVFDEVDYQLVSLDYTNNGNDDGTRSAASSMSVDLELFENGGQSLDQSSDREGAADQTVVENTVQSSEPVANEPEQEKPPESDATMETDTEKESQGGEDKENVVYQIPSLTKQLQLDDLWIILSECLTELEKTPDHHAALILQPAVEAFFLVHSTAINECRALANSSGSSTAPAVPRRNRGDGPLPLMPIFPDLNFGICNLIERPQQTSNVLVSVTTPNVASGSAQGLSQENSQQPRTGQNNSFGHIITEYRRFIQALGVTNSGPLSVDVDTENSAESASTSQQQHQQHCNDLNSTSLAAFFKQTENSPLLDPFKFLRFAELHRAVLNQILRQSTTHLPNGPFAILVNFTRVLDFDVKRKYFRQELQKMHNGSRRGDETAVNVNRSHVFEESFRELHRKSPEEWKNKFYVVFESEEGQDAGGLLREWYMIISREIFNPNYALFTVSPGDRVTYTINPSSHCNPNHLLYFKFVGRLIAKAIYDSKYLECYFTRSFYKHILGIPVKYQDMENEDPEFYEGLVYLKNHKVSELGNDLTFTTDVQEFGVTESRELKPNGANIPVTEENKMDYIHLVCQMKMTGAIRKQLDAFLEGFYEIIPKHLISIFNEQELELLISGLPNIDIDDLKNNTEYNKYSRNSIQIVWFWRALREMDSQDQAKFLQFVTGTSKVPLQGFAALEGMNGIQKFQIHRDDRSTDRLPSAHTCFNQLDLPAYETYTKLKNNLLKAIHECSEGFGFV